MARALGGLLILVGIGSFLYHASATRALRHLDVGAMYWVFLVAAVFGLSALSAALRTRFERSATGITIAMGAIAIGLTAGRNFRVFGLKPFSLEIATGLAAAILITTLIWVAQREGTLAAFGRVGGIVALFAAGVACQLADRAGGPWFSPQHAIQAHAAWHVLAAAAFVGAVRQLDRADSDARRPRSCRD